MDANQVDLNHVRFYYMLIDILFNAYVDVPEMAKWLDKEYFPKEIQPLVSLLQGYVSWNDETRIHFLEEFFSMRDEFICLSGNSKGVSWKLF
jgi:hypothetical protein